MDEELASFTPSPWIHRLNTAAVTLSCAAMSSVICLKIFRRWEFVIPVLLATVPCVTLWQWALRQRERASVTPLYTGWGWSLPYAAANTLLAAALLHAETQGFTPAIQYLLLVVFGLTLGAIVWIPACLLTVGTYGLALAQVKRLGDFGQRRQDQSEQAVALIAAMIALAAGVGSQHVTDRPDYGWGHRLDASRIGLKASIALALCSALLVNILAFVRIRARARLLKATQQGALPNYRVDTRPGETVLVRVEVGDAYRGQTPQDVAIVERTGELPRNQPDSGNKLPGGES